MRCPYGCGAVGKMAPRCKDGHGIRSIKCSACNAGSGGKGALALINPVHDALRRGGARAAADCPLPPITFSSRKRARRASLGSRDASPSRLREPSPEEEQSGHNVTEAQLAGVLARLESLERGKVTAEGALAKVAGDLVVLATHVDLSLIHI